MNKVEYWYTDDSFIRAESVLKRAIGQFANRNRWVYIGLTQQRPEDRFYQHQRKWEQGHRWDRMIVVYYAKTFTLMHTVEDRLIKYVQKQIDLGKYDCELINELDSQYTQIAKNFNGYWVYILLQK